MKLIIISGRSGSGKSVVLNTLEDLGYYCVDNIPVSLLPALVHALKEDYEKIAISIDVRNMPKESDVLGDSLEFMPGDFERTILYLDASDDILIKRYSETRRLHPLTKHNMSLVDAIKAESELLAPLKEKSDLTIDTDKFSIHQLSEIVRERILGKKSSRVVLVFESFGFKHGIPKDADYVFDVRFLPNPHWIPELKPFTGKDLEVANYLGAQPMVNKLIWQVQNFIDTWLPHLERNNRSYVSVAIGCTGGQHRSVFIAESLAARFQVSHPDVQIRHRELTE
ncbi:MAG: RNase adapter RapZ [Alteromonadaceae bacterium]|nr:RNase adapter RapZ [Alteromonadaceae bacterium]